MPSSASIRLPSASGVGNGFFLQGVTTSTARPHPASASPPRIGNPARHERCRQEGGSRQARQAAMTDGLPSSVDVFRKTVDWNEGEGNFNFRFTDSPSEPNK